MKIDIVQSLTQQVVIRDSQEVFEFPQLNFC